MSPLFHDISHIFKVLTPIFISLHHYQIGEQTEFEI